MSAARPVRIRAATAADVPVIIELIRGLADYEALASEMIATEADLDRHLFGARPAAEVVLAETAAAAHGFAVYFSSFSTFLGRPGIYVEDIFVRPESRGRGIGRQLLEHLAAVAVERGCGRLEWSVLDWNESAIGFYERLGARPLGEWTMYRLTGQALSRLGKKGN